MPAWVGTIIVVLRDLAFLLLGSWGMFDQLQAERMDGFRVALCLAMMGGTAVLNTAWLARSLLTAGQQPSQPPSSSPSSLS